MSTPGQKPPAEGDQPLVPWWLGRGVGLALLVAVMAVLWTSGWGVATQAQRASPPPARWWDDTELELATVSVSTPPSRSSEPSDRSSTAPTVAPSRDGTGESETFGTDVEVPAAPTDRASRAEELRQRQEARERRALRADRQLAEFIESVGVLDVLGAWVAPISDDYRITATFGQAGSLWSKDHTGVDLAAPAGTPVVSVSAGTVSSAGDAGAYGMQVKVVHNDGTETSYSHMSRIDVTEGQVVAQGALVGAVGSTGNSTGPHLHLELRPGGGVPIDPVGALLARGVTL